MNRNNRGFEVHEIQQDQPHIGERKYEVKGCEMGKSALAFALFLPGLYLIGQLISILGKMAGQGKPILVWYLFAEYVYYLEIPFTILSFGFAKKGLNEENKIPTYLSFVVNGIKIMIILLAIF